MNAIITRIYIERWDKFFTQTVFDLRIPVVTSQSAIDYNKLIPANGEFNFCRSMK